MEGSKWKIDRIPDLRTSISDLQSMPMTFEDLECWRQARQLVRGLYELTRQPEIARDFGLCGQVQRAGVSIMSNTAEGFERKHVPEKLQFYNIARGSSAEVRSLLYVVEDNYPASGTGAVQLRAATVEVGKLVTGLIRSTEKRQA
jgi:four helix bundle protein